MENVIEQAEVAKMFSLIDLDTKYIRAINNIDMDIAKDLRLTNGKKY